VKLSRSLTARVAARVADTLQAKLTSAGQVTKEVIRKIRIAIALQLYFKRDAISSFGRSRHVVRFMCSSLLCGLSRIAASNAG